MAFWNNVRPGRVRVTSPQEIVRSFVIPLSSSSSILSVLDVSCTPCRCLVSPVSLGLVLMKCASVGVPRGRLKGRVLRSWDSPGERQVCLINFNSALQFKVFQTLQAKTNFPSLSFFPAPAGNLSPHSISSILVRI